MTTAHPTPAPATIRSADRLVHFVRMAPAPLEPFAAAAALAPPDRWTSAEFPRDAADRLTQFVRTAPAPLEPLAAAAALASPDRWTGGAEFARDAAVRLAGFVRTVPALLEPLAAVAALGLPDCWVGAGFIRNAVWDALHGLPFGANPPADVDVVWFDPGRASAATDAAVEARLHAAHPGPAWSVRNQARMAARNGDAPYRGTLHAMKSWPETATAVAARLHPATGAVEVAAPWGLDDLLAGIVRPTPAFAADPAKRRVFAERAAAKAWRRRWPGLLVFNSAPQEAAAAPSRPCPIAASPAPRPGPCWGRR